MDNYYDEILAEIEEAAESGRYDEAMLMINKELRMPYVPPQTESRLNEMKRDLKWKMADQRQMKEDSLSSLLAGLKGDPKHQLISASKLTGRNLRDCIEEIRSYLAGNPVPEAAALLIEALGEQQVGEEFVYMKDGLEYTFWGDSVIPVAESEGFNAAAEYLSSWLLNKHPDIHEMCRTLLIHEAYVFLPLSYESEEAEELALDIVRQVSEMMDDGELYREVLEKNDVHVKTGILN